MFNHLMYTDDLKTWHGEERETWRKKLNVFFFICQKWKRTGTVIQTIRIYTHDIRMEFDIEKCAILRMKSGKIETGDGIEQQNLESIRIHWEKEKLLVLGDMGTRHNETEMKEK